MCKTQQLSAEKGTVVFIFKSVGFERNLQPKTRRSGVVSMVESGTRPKMRKLQKLAHL